MKEIPLPSLHELQKPEWNCPESIPVEKWSATNEAGETILFQKFGNILLTYPTFSTKTPEDIQKLVTLSGLSSESILCIDYPLHLDENEETDDILLKDKEIFSSEGMLLGYTFKNEQGTIINIDHHFRDARFACQISSTPLAGEFVRSRGRTYTAEQGIILIHHLDGDSILSALVAAGLLPPNIPEIDMAAIDGDHTGEENIFADVLNAIQDKKDLQQTLFAILRYPAVDSRFSKAFEQRSDERKTVLAEAQKYATQVRPGVYLVQIDGELRAEFLPAAFPDAELIFLRMPYKGKTEEERARIAEEREKGNDAHDYRIRLGNKAPSTAQLNTIGLHELGFGGRWNAGGTKRGGPVFIAPKDFVTEVLNRYDSKLNFTP